MHMPSLALAKTPIHAAQGTGQILGMGDTGIDLDSCFFRDSNLPATSAGNWPLDSTSHQLFNSTVHRKIAMYRALQDVTDGNGHGTHCAGSAAGSFQNGVLIYARYIHG